MLVSVYVYLLEALPFTNSISRMSKCLVIVQVESNGTVLSTNWNEVGSKMVEGSPPDGMEVKKWEY